MKLIGLVLFTFALSTVQCAKLLCVFPFPSPSHYNLGSSLAKGLAAAGHDVTIITPFLEKTPPTGKYREIYLSGFKEESDKKQLNLFEFGDMNNYLTILFMNMLGNECTEKTFGHPNVQKLLKSGEHFDAVIVEQFVNDGMKVFAHHFNAPLILFSAVGANGWVNPLVANPSPPSYVPDLFLSYSDRMSFFQRVHNTIFSIISELNRHLIFFPAQNKIVKTYFPNAPDLSELLYNSSLVLLNSQISINIPTPLVPSMINIGGYHVNPKKTPLPEDLEDFINGAKDGVIYFSMGSNLKSKDLPKETVKSILETFSELKERIIWKFEDDSLPSQPENLKIGKWLPQQDILAHPNVKLFITHGGLLSTTETIYHGVPALAIPIFGDQKMNAAQIELRGFGISFDIKDLSNKQKFIAVLRTVLDDPKYTENAKKRSKLMFDQPMKQMDSAVWWVEYVIRHNGATHLRVAGLELPWYKYLLIDVFAFLVLIPITLIVLLRIYLKTRKSCKKTDSNKKKQ